MNSFWTTITLPILALFLLFTDAQSQTVATIDGDEIEAKELLYAFNKNRQKNNPLLLDSLENYLQQYINFKLKVRAARKLGLDTAQSFQDELQGYLSQIKKPYLENPKAEEALIRETYNRLSSDLNASHILIKVGPQASPQDTLKAYKFLDSLRLTIGSKPEFEEMARRHSQDGSAQNGGNLGWFTAMHMVAPFEDGAYKTPVGKVSRVVRSNFGYHLIYINAKRDNRGKIKTSHIFFTKQRGNNEARQRAFEVYDSLRNGSDWFKMVDKYSDDRGTRQDGGKLPWAGIKQLPDDFLDIAYSIDSIGNYSQPRETTFGWHIVKLDDFQPLEPFEVKREEISEMLKNTGRNNLEEKKLIEKLKEENHFKQNKDSLNAIIELVKGNNKEKILSEKIAKKVIFKHGDTFASVKDFAESLPGFRINYTKDQLLEFYKNFEKRFIINYEDSIAPIKYPEYGFLMKEYEEGLLLFEIMQQKIWGKASQDSLGLQSFYNENKQKYIIGERISCLLLSSHSEELLNQVSKIRIPIDSLAQAETILSRKLNKENMGELKIAKRNLLASEFSNFEAIKDKQGYWLETSEGMGPCLNLGWKKEGPQLLDEIKGIVMADYQEALDKAWVKELKQGAKIKISMKELKAITK